MSKRNGVRKSSLYRFFEDFCLGVVMIHLLLAALCVAGGMLGFAVRLGGSQAFGGVTDSAGMATVSVLTGVLLAFFVLLLSVVWIAAAAVCGLRVRADEVYRAVVAVDGSLQAQGKTCGWIAQAIRQRWFSSIGNISGSSAASGIGRDAQ